MDDMHRIVRDQWRALEGAVKAVPGDPKHDAYVVREASRFLDRACMRVGPNTDAVVWKLCDTNETVEL